MQKPPPKPKVPDDLAEVERAMSILQGRNPEFERARREDEEARAKRKAEIDARAAAEARRTRKRRVVIGAIVLVVAGFTVFAGTVFRSEISRRGRVEQASDTYRSMGFVVIETSGRGSPGSLEETAEKGCMLAVSTGDAPIKVTRPAGDPIEGKGPILFCTCAAEKLTVTSKVAAGGGLSLLRIEGSEIGGSKAYAYLPFKPGTMARTDDACAEAELDAWIDAKRFPAVAAAAADNENKWLKSDAKRAAALEPVGFRTIGTIAADKPFVIVDLPKDSCVVAASSVAEDKLTLRTKGGSSPMANAPGAFAWCAAKESSGVIVREGTGDVAIIAAPVSKVGGTAGLEEILETAGMKIPDAQMGVPVADRAWNAKALLVASAVPDGLITTASAPDIPADTLARLDAVSFGSPNALVADVGADVFSFCEPPLAEKQPDSLCVFSGPHTWKISSAESVGGVARAKLPFWLFAMEGVSEPTAMKAATALVTFARRMRREGFEPTTIEAMTETPNGVEVLGRTGEDAIIGVGIAPVEPWIFPYGDSTGMPVWSIEKGKPAILPIKLLEKVKLVANARTLPSKETRRSVVFRRQQKN